MTTVATCTMCDSPSYLGAMHPCCERAMADGADRCFACAESTAAEVRHQRRAADCQCAEHQGARG